MTYTIRLFTFLIFFSFLSCNKEENKKDIVKEAIVFPDLGEDGPYNYGQTYQGRNGYTTYYPGNIPVILSIPHGGDISPSEISNRTYGVSVTDSNTIELGIAIRNYFYSNYNQYMLSSSAHLLSNSVSLASYVWKSTHYYCWILDVLCL